MKHYPRIRSMRAAFGRFNLLILAASALAACDRAADDPLAPVGQSMSGYAFANVNVVSMTSEQVDANQTVIVQDDRIVAAGPAASVDIPEGARIIEGRGKYLAPGLADMHAHPMTTANLDAYLANGVTLIRAMWGEPAVLELRRGVAEGNIPGPRILTGGRIVDGEPIIHYGSDSVLNAADAREVVTRHKSAGYDFIKVYSNLGVEAGLSPFAALQTATTASAEFMNESGQSGIVAQGARADLVLLDGNPLEDVAAYREIDGVMAAGRWFDRESLDERLVRVKAASDSKAAVFRDAPPWPIQGHFYFTGANRHDITITDPGGTRELSVWMGGGFYSGWPVKILEKRAGPDARATDYRRIL